MNFLKSLSKEERNAFFDGLRMTILIVPSYLPFALVCGVSAVSVGMQTGAALAMPALVFAGSSQAVLTQFMQDSAALWIAVLSGLVVNLRMAVYSAAFAPYLREQSVSRRMLAAFFLVDNAFAFTQQRAQERPQDAQGAAQPLLAYYAGIVVILWPAWVLFCAIGVFAGQFIPASWQLEFALPLSFIAILATSVRSLAMFSSALIGLGSSVVLFALPLKLGLIAACLLGLLVGLWVQQIFPVAPDTTDTKDAA